MQMPGVLAVEAASFSIKNQQALVLSMDSRFSECQDPDLNWGHGDFQSPALPTELSRHVAFATWES